MGSNSNPVNGVLSSTLPSYTLDPSYSLRTNPSSANTLGEYDLSDLQTPLKSEQIVTPDNINELYSRFIKRQSMGLGAGLLGLPGPGATFGLFRPVLSATDLNDLSLTDKERKQLIGNVLVNQYLAALPRIDGITGLYFTNAESINVETDLGTTEIANNLGTSQLAVRAFDDLTWHRMAYQAELQSLGLIGIDQSRFGKVLGYGASLLSGFQLSFELGDMSRLNGVAEIYKEMPSEMTEAQIMQYWLAYNDCEQLDDGSFNKDECYITPENSAAAKDLYEEHHQPKHEAFPDALNSEHIVAREYGVMPRISLNNQNFTAKAIEDFGLVPGTIIGSVRALGLPIVTSQIRINHPEFHPYILNPYNYNLGGRNPVHNWYGGYDGGLPPSVDLEELRGQQNKEARRNELIAGGLGVLAGVGSYDLNGSYNTDAAQRLAYSSRTLLTARHDVDLMNGFMMRGVI